MEDPKYIEDFTTQELEAELEYRRTKQPERLVHTNWTPVADYAKRGVSFVGSEGRMLKDFEHDLMVLVLQAMYGDTIWAWWNRKLSGQ